VRRAFVGLGSNVEPARHLRAALAGLDRTFSGLQRSPVCVSPAEGYDGPDYWNLCAAFDTALPAGELVLWLKGLERSQGRRPGESRHAPKTLDADLLLLGGTVSRQPPLPHPEVLTRSYVLGPLAMLAPDLLLPGAGTRLEDLWRDFEGAGALTILDPDPL
jgi:2-amino-4-hydroxy-6-hydroxymethyldihydropteridine diphosphokinase